MNKGVSKLGPGDTLNLREGVYVGAVDVGDLHGTTRRPILIRSYPGETAVLDGSLQRFRAPSRRTWIPAQRFYRRAADDEYVSRARFKNFDVGRGAFLDRRPYTRLITYGRLEDLRAANETFAELVDPNDARPGPAVLNEAGRAAGFRYPWVYMGPGLWFNRGSRRVHIRLSHTHNNLSGLPDYERAEDPRQVRLALSRLDKTTLHVHGTKNVQFRDLAIRHGGEQTVLLENVDRVDFDHVRIWASTYGVRFANARRTRFHDSEFNGGRPTWYFRSDQKAEYRFRKAGRRVKNLLGKQTTLSLMFGSRGKAIEIDHSEFTNAHDLHVSGHKVQFHHNWVDNMTDETLLLDAIPTRNAKVSDNVITRARSAVSFGGDEVGGPYFVYRNLVDLREPIPSHRPRCEGDTAVWTHGQLFKSNGTDGTWDLFQNTLLVSSQPAPASFTHFRSVAGRQRHRSFNNIFVAIHPTDVSRSITLLPPPTEPRATDGNGYYRIGGTSVPAYRYLPYEGDQPPRFFSTLDDLGASSFFRQSKAQYGPGYEADSIEGDPGFLRLGSDGARRLPDDLRLSATSQGAHAGVALPHALAELDPSADDDPYIGRYRIGSGPLRVGVDGRRLFPKTGEVVALRLPQPASKPCPAPQPRAPSERRSQPR